jgi:excisionase family DNA binding protein
MTEKLLNAKAVAEILGVSKSFVYQLARQKLLKAVKIQSSVRFRQEDLDAYIQSILVKD